MVLPAVLKDLSGMEGLYNRGETILNGYQYWKQENEKHAIWFSRDQKRWMIGEYSLRGRGTKEAKIRSEPIVHYSHPYGGDGYLWQYYQNAGWMVRAGWSDLPDIQLVEGKNCDFVQ